MSSSSAARGSSAPRAPQRAVETGLDLFVLNRGTTSHRPLPPQARRAGRRRPRPGLRAARPWPTASSTSSSTTWPSPPITSAPTSSCSAADRPVRLHQLRIGLPDAAGPAARHRVDPAAQPLLAVLPRQDRLRGPAGRTPTGRTGFPVTIVRPSHTYDHTSVPFDGGWTAVDRMRRGVPVVVHGDGTTLWTLTHHVDFARAFVAAAGRPPGRRRHLPHHLRRGADVGPDRRHARRGRGRRAAASCTCRPTRWPRSTPTGAPACSATSPTPWCSTTPRSSRWCRAGNATIPFARGAREIVEWHDADPDRRAVDSELDARMDRLVEAHLPCTP